MTWGDLGRLWGDLRRLWGDLGMTWSAFEVILAEIGNLLGAFGARFSRNRCLWDGSQRHQSDLGCLWGDLGRRWDDLGRAWCDLGRLGVT